MTDRHRDDDRLAEDLRQAFSHRAEGVEPSADAYARLAAAATKADTAPSAILMVARPALVSVAVVAVVMGMGVWAQGLGDDSISIAQGAMTMDGSGGSADGEAQVAQAPDESSAEAADEESEAVYSRSNGSGSDSLVGDLDREQPPTTAFGSSRITRPVISVGVSPGGVLVGDDTIGIWPEEPRIGAVAAGDTALAAARGLTGLIGRPGLELIEELDGVIETPVGSIDVEFMEGATWIVTGAHSEGLSVTVDPALTPGSTVDDTVAELIAVAGPSATLIEVSGSVELGEGDGDRVQVVVWSATDERLLVPAQTIAVTSDGGGTYHTMLALPGAERAWVVVSTSNRMAAVPIAYRATESVDPGQGDLSEAYTVIRIPRSDPDQGLVVRRAPGEGHEQLDVIPAGSSDVVRVNQVPVHVDPSAWWLVETPDGIHGWVNSTFLARATPMSEADAANLALRVNDALEAGTVEALSALPLASRVAVRTGHAERTVESWRHQTVVDWLAAWVAEAEADQVDTTEAALDQGGTAGLETYFGSLPSVSVAIGDPAKGGSQLQVFVEQTVTGPVIVGLITS